jgi:hypothetical protein
MTRQEAQQRVLQRKLEAAVLDARTRLRDPALSVEGRANAREELQVLRLARLGISAGPRQAHALRMHGVWLKRPMLIHAGGCVHQRFV